MHDKINNSWAGALYTAPEPFFLVGAEGRGGPVPKGSEPYDLARGRAVKNLRLSYPDI